MTQSYTIIVIQNLIMSIKIKFFIAGIILQNSRKFKTVKFVNNEKQADRYIAKPQFKKFNIIDENLTLVELQKSPVVLDKPVAAGSNHYCITITLQIPNFN